MKFRREWAAACWLGVTLLAATPAAAAARIEAVTAEVTALEHLPPPVAARMEKSVAAIGEQLLLGRSAALSEADAAAQAALLGEVFDKVLVGYTVTGASITPGETATIHLSLVPWSDTVQQVHVTTAVEGMPPEIEALVRRDLAGVESVFDRSLIGLPVAAADWTNGVLKREVSDYFAKNLPEFRADFDVVADKTAKVTLTVYPRLPVVRTVDLSMRSDTLPNSLLLTHRELMKERTSLLVGVPVAFVRRHESEISALLARSLDERPDFRAMRATSHVMVTPAERAAVMSRTDAKKLRLRLTGWLDIGRGESELHAREEDLLFRAHLGYQADRQDELYTLLDLYPQDARARFQAGFLRSLGTGFSAGLRYDFDASRIIYDFRYEPFPRWLLRYEYHAEKDRSETALRYKLHDFLALEWAADRESSWLRLIGNF